MLLKRTGDLIHWNIQKNIWIHILTHNLCVLMVKMCQAMGKTQHHEMSAIGMYSYFNNSVFVIVQI